MPSPPRPADPRVGVVVVTRDRADDLAVTLEHLRRDAGAARVVVVDNGSRDGSVAVAATAGPPVEVVALPDNLGAAGRNVGAARLDTPYIAFADDDSWWAPGALSAAADLFDAHPRLGLLNGRVLVEAEERLDPVCAEMAASPLPAAPDLPGPSLLGFIACGAVVRRDAFLAAGGFATELGVGGEEELLALDLAAAGWGLCYVDAVVAHHHPSPSRNPAGRRRRLAHNRVWIGWCRLPVAWALRRTAEQCRRALADRAVAAGTVQALADVRGLRRRRRVLPPPVLDDLARLERDRPRP